MNDKEETMQSTEKLEYLKDLYEWDEKTIKNVQSYGRSLVEEALRTDGKFAQMVKDNCGEGEAEKYICHLTQPRYLIKHDFSDSELEEMGFGKSSNKIYFTNHFTDTEES